ncbi:MAG: aldehyde ferredoxin oxidoreductase N-terminal domain-containing protein [bacterium]
MIGKGYIKVLGIDLTSRTIEVTRREDLMDYLGGSGVATKLLEENIRRDEDPLDPDQPIIFAIGPMTTIFPVVTKVAAAFKSPLTGNFGESHAGGRLGMAMLFAGYDAIVIKGKSKRPVYLSISPNDVSFNDATPLWGMRVLEAGRILRELETKIGGGKRSIIRIGPAGEACVRFASVNVDTYRHFGRLGLGATFGSKNLKAIVIGGKRSYEIPNKKEYNRVYRKIYEMATSSSAMKKYHELGTPQNILPLNDAQSLPTRNLRESQFEGAREISGESFAEELLLRKNTCSGCPVGCIHIGLLRQEFAPGYEYKYTGVSYDYELIYSLGTLLGMGKKEEILALIEAVEEEGLDAISTGVILSWMTEAQERGIIGEPQVGAKLLFGDAEGYLKAIENISKRPNDFYDDVALGLAALSERYGGEDFALTLGRNEMAGYHTGYAFSLGQAVGARHSHLDNAGYSFDQMTKDYRPEEMVDYLIEEEAERCLLTSLHICLFARKIYGDTELVSEALRSIGIERTPEELGEIGRRIFALKLKVKTENGFKYDQLRFPRRLFETETLHGRMDEEFLRQTLSIYVGKIDGLLTAYQAAAPPDKQNFPSGVDTPQ